MGAIEGTFEVLSTEEQALFDAGDGVRLAHASGTQRFSGGIEGDGSVDWLMCYLAGAEARFVGLQRIDGTIDGRRGSLVLEAVGGHDGTRIDGDLADRGWLRDRRTRGHPRSRGVQCPRRPDRVVSAGIRVRLTPADQAGGMFWLRRKRLVGS